MKSIQRKEQKGVVLLSCLIFLLLILILLRFNLGSAKLQEMKAGADYDNLSAQASAQMVMEDAENYIMRVNKDNISLIPGSQTNEAKALNYWRSDGSLTPAGVYDGDDSGNALATCKPSYTCIDWSSNTCGTQDGTICFGTATGAKAYRANTDGNGGVTLEDVADSKKIGKYIIERFTGDGSTIGLTGSSQRNAPIYLRVTAVGFSKASGVSRNTSNAILQNTYVLVSE